MDGFAKATHKTGKAQFICQAIDGKNEEFQDM